MGFMFYNCRHFTGKGLNSWKPIKCENMECMFTCCYNFNCDLSGWDVSNIKNMSGMFYDCIKFTGEGLNNWKPIKNSDMHSMFLHCKNFDCDLSGWDVSNVNDMGEMFKDCTKFMGRGLDEWKPIKCENMHSMFNYCKKFNCDLSGWDVSNV